MQRSIKLDWIFYELLNLKGLIKIFLLLKYLLRLEDTFIILTLFRILLYLLFYDDLLMLKAAAKFRNFSFYMWLVFCLFLYLLKPQSLVQLFVVQPLSKHWVTLHMFFSLMSLITTSMGHCVMDGQSSWSSLSQRDVVWIRTVEPQQVREGVLLNVPKME